MQIQKVQRTTLNLPIQLIKEVQEILGAKNKTDAIVLALSEITRRQKMITLTKKLAGKVKINLTQSQLKKMRRDRF
jgi:hypothetical protein